MPRTRTCDFCGDDIEPGTGTLFVRSNGASVYFCSAKCEKNANLGREARDLEWTAAGQRHAEADAAETSPISPETAERPAPDLAAAEADTDTPAGLSDPDAGDKEPEEQAAGAPVSTDQDDEEASTDETGVEAETAETADDEAVAADESATNDTTDESDEPVDASSADGSEEGDTEGGESDEEAEA